MVPPIAYALGPIWGTLLVILWYAADTHSKVKRAEEKRKQEEQGGQS